MSAAVVPAIPWRATPALVAVGWLFCTAVGWLGHELLQLLPVPGRAWTTLDGVLAMAYAATCAPVILRGQPDWRYSAVAVVAATLLEHTPGWPFPAACAAGLALAAPLFAWPARPGWQPAALARCIHNLQNLAILAGIVLSFRHPGLRLPLVLTAASGMAHWHRRVFGHCPFTLWEASRREQPELVRSLHEQGYFVTWLRHWLPWAVTRAQAGWAITALLTGTVLGWIVTS